MRYLTSIGSYIENHSTSFYLLLAILLVGTFLRVYGLGEQSYWLDEIITLHVAQESLDSIITGPRPPLYLVLAHFWIGNFGYSEDVTRLLSIIFGVSSIVLIYIVGKSLFNREVGVLSAFFMSVSQYQIYYSQELRYYSLFLFMTLISFFFYIHVLKTKRHIYAVFYVLSSILLYYSHDYGIFILAAQNLYFVLNIKSLRLIITTWFLSQTIILFAILPGLISVFNLKVIGLGGLEWLESPRIWTPFITLHYYIGAGLDYPPLKAVVIACIFLLTATFLYYRSIGKERRLELRKSSAKVFKSLKIIKSEILLLVIWLVVPIFMVLVLSEIIKPMYHHRYLICSAPAFYILIALVLTKINNLIPISIILITYVILISAGLYDYYSNPVREQWKQAAAYVAEHERPDDLIVITDLRSSESFKWYYGGNSNDCIVSITNAGLFDEQNACKLDINRFWVVIRKEISEKDKESFLNYKEGSFRIVDEKKFTVILGSKEILRSIYFGRLTLYLFEKVGDNPN